MNKYIVVVLLFSLISCRNAEQSTVGATDSTATGEQAVDQVVSLEDPNVQAIYTAYIDLKDDLVNAKFEDAKQSAAALATQLATHEGCENTALIAKKINNAKDLTTQRKEFTALNTDIIPLIKHASIKEGTVYVQHCPMANQGDGGDWLSSRKNIENPYYGDEMMECGAVIEEIKGNN